MLIDLFPLPLPRVVTHTNAHPRMLLLLLPASGLRSASTLPHIP